jgi:hypothetical protein
MPDALELQCPYCNNKLNAVRLGYETERFGVGDAILCALCGQFGVLQSDWKIIKATIEDTCRWSCTNPVEFEKFEMMAADFRRDAAERQ